MTRVQDERSRAGKAHSRTVNTEEKTDRRRNPAALSTTSGNPLQLLLARRMMELGEGGKPLTLRQVEERSGRSHGRFRVSRSTVANVVNGKAIKLTPDTVTGLARALQIDEHTITHAIEQTTALTMDLPGKLRKLSPEGWRDLLEYGEFLLSREGK